MGKGLRVAMVGPALDAPGGMTSVVLACQAAGLCSRWQVTFLASYRRPGLFQQLRTAPVALGRLLVLLLTCQLDLVHANSASRGSFWRKSAFCWLAWCWRVPYVFHIHSGEFINFYQNECKPWAQAWVRWVLRHAARVLVLAPDWEQAIGAIEPAARRVVMVNPISIPAKALVLRDEPRRLLFLGRLREKKGVFDLVRALPAVLAQFPEVVTCIAGDEDLPGVRALARELGVEHSIELPGWIGAHQKQRELNRADIFVMPSHFEAISISILEAMAAGLPVAASAVGGIPYALDHGRCGMLFEAGDPKALANAIIELIRDPVERARLATNARHRAENLFSAERVVADLESIWRECIGVSPFNPAEGQY